MFESRSRTAPSGYKDVRILFHSLRSAQLLASMIVGAIMSYFIYHLTQDHWGTPWTFIVLTVVSLLTVAFLLFTIILHLFTGLKAQLNLALNTLLFVLWGMGFGMLAYWMSGTLKHHCDVSNWTDDTGIMVCRIYKALFSFALLGFVATVCALALDVYIHRLGMRRGRHMRLSDADAKRRAAAVRGPYTDMDDDEEELEMRGPEIVGRPSDAFEVPPVGYGAHITKGAQGQGYEVPEGQFDYDTGYHGGHAERVFGSS